MTPDSILLILTILSWVASSYSLYHVFQLVALNTFLTSSANKAFEQGQRDLEAAEELITKTTAELQGKLLTLDLLVANDAKQAEKITAIDQALKFSQQRKY